MKRVLLLIKGLGVGGAEEIVAATARYLDRSRFECELAYHLPAMKAIGEELRREGFAVHDLDGARGVGWVGRLGALVRRRRIDLVHMHSPYTAIGARLGLSRHGIPIVYTEHNEWKAYHLLTYWGNALTFPRNDHVFAVSEGVLRSMRYPAPLRRLSMPRVEVLHHGFDPRVLTAAADGARAELGIAEDAPVVGTVAEFRPEKAHVDLLDAAVIVRDAIPNVRFVLVGGGPLEGKIRRRAAELGLERTVLFTGWRDDACRLMRSFDVFALSSVHEGLPIALLEAMALSRPAVVTPVGGIPEVIRDGHDGVMVPPRRPNALADALTALLRDSRRRQTLGEHARRRSSEFDISKAVRRMEEVYEELLD